MFKKHPLADSRAALIELMVCVPQCGKEKRPRTLAGQRMDEFTVEVNWRSPRGVDHFHPASNTLLAEADYYGQKKRTEFCKKTSWGAPAYALLTAAAVPFKAMLE